VSDGTVFSSVMPGLVPGIHAFPSQGGIKTWMAGTGPAMTDSGSYAGAAV